MRAWFLCGFVVFLFDFVVFSKSFHGCGLGKFQIGAGTIKVRVCVRIFCVLRL